MSNHSGKAGMGSAKHGKTGWKNGAGKSPKLRHHMKREAEKDERKAKKTTTKFYSSVMEAFERK